MRLVAGGIPIKRCQPQINADERRLRDQSCGPQLFVSIRVHLRFILFCPNSTLDHPHAYHAAMNEVVLDSPEGVLPAEARPQLSSKFVLALTVLLGGFAGLGPLAIDMYLPSYPAIAAD